MKTFAKRVERQMNPQHLKLGRDDTLDFLLVNRDKSDIRATV